MSVLSLNSVSYKYEGTKKSVLKKVSTEFNTGKIYVIMGRSGSGKTTLLSLISGLETTDMGKILHNGTDLKITNRDDYRAKDIGVIFQSYNLINNMTAIENIILSLNVSGTKEKNLKEVALKILEKVGFDKETSKRKVLKLSGGEQQRVGIARAIANNPNIVIADEPTGNLDETTEENIMTILSNLAHEENKCVIVVTHSTNVSKWADELYGLNNGTLHFVK